MHELSVAQNLIKKVLIEMKHHKRDKILKVGILVGKYSYIVPSALEFCFDAAKTDTVLADVALDIEIEIPKGKCLDCGHLFQLEEWNPGCPVCNSESIMPDGGTEIALQYLEYPD